MHGVTMKFKEYVNWERTRALMRRFFYFSILNREVQHIHLWLAEVIMTALPRIFMFLAWYKHTRNFR